MNQQLLEACRKGEIEDVKRLLRDPNVNVNFRDDEGYTPMECAFHSRVPQVIEALIKDKRVDVLAHDHYATHPIWVWFLDLKHLELMMVYKEIPDTLNTSFWDFAYLTEKRRELLAEYEADRAKTRRRLRKKHKIGHEDAASLFVTLCMIE